VAVTMFEFSVLSDKRDDVIREMDAIALQILQAVGGEPWVAVDDDVQRKPMSPNPTSDDDFAYFGKRSMVFKGPMKFGDNSLPFHDGFRPQKGESDD
jgi:hypothetical protein